jgi:cation diffusion facilitator CzcD-associated flavoprotein CzcO
MAFREFPAPYTPTSPSDPLAITYPPCYLSSSASAASNADASASLPTFHGYSRLFPPRREVQAYLEAYADAYGLRQHIRFGVRVERVYSPRRHESGTEDGNGIDSSRAGRRWRIHSRALSSSQRAHSTNGAGASEIREESEAEAVEDFDYVCCANGHYADTWIPEIVGLR